MNILPNGTMIFDDKYELIYELLNELEYEVQPDGSIIDESNNILYFNEMKVLATIDPKYPKYPGQGEIDFDILNNVRLSTVLFGRYLEKKIAAGMPFVSYYPGEMTIPNPAGKNLPDKKISNLTVKFDNTHDLSTPFFKNKCLKFIYMIFKLEEQEVDLSNMDVEEVHADDVNR